MMNLKDLLYIDDDGTLCSIVNMFDFEGFDTENVEDVVAIVVKRSDNEFFVVSIEEGIAPALCN